jgi:16S rRNA (cytosine967-C5)-methyltransferase
VRGPYAPRPSGPTRERSGAPAGRAPYTRGPSGPPRDRGGPPERRQRTVFGKPRDGRNPRAGAEERREPRLPSNPREAALQILFSVDTRSAFSDRLLDMAHDSDSGMSAVDRSLMHELVKGTLRWRGRLDWVLAERIHIGFDQLPPWIQNVLRLGAYQLLFLDRVPVHAAVDESVKLATRYGHPGTAGLVNGVLRRVADEKDTIVPPAGDDVASLAIWGSHPEWMVARWLDRFGVEGTRALMLANNRPSPLGLRVNPLRGTREQLIAALAAEGATAEPSVLASDHVRIDGNHSPQSLAAFRDGLCTAQDESECLVSRLLAPVKHERVLDLCAAPGGKCTHIAEMMGDDGEVWAMEQQARRIQSIEQNLARLGLHSIHAVEGDGRRYEFPMPFDRVLVDAPCSGLGVLGRRADARWRKEPSSLVDMPAVQLDLLLAAAQRARPGGTVVYSVCSFEPEETEAVVERFLRQAPNMVLESAAGILPDAVVDANGFMRVLPHVHGCDGAFAARFRRT